MAFRPSPWRLVALLVGPALLGSGCTSALGIDGVYVEESAGGRKPGTGKAGSSGSATTGGTAGESGGGGGSAGGSATGGAPGSGGIPAAGGFPNLDAGACPACQPDEKCCYGICLKVGPGNGCAPESCAPCPAPPDNAVGKCTGTTCDFDCVNETTRNGDVCEPNATGSGGGQGAGGAPAKCVASQCPTCPGDPIYKACCQQNDTCGCGFPFAPCFP
ncbi:MAG TPA: hypothetical protein VHE30_01820 [Polyangiaceae bacterium]|nr:hypothetical protein [Polyangiaceae bacterium]